MAQTSIPPIGSEFHHRRSGNRAVVEGVEDPTTEDSAFLVRIHTGNHVTYDDPDEFHRDYVSVDK